MIISLTNRSEGENEVIIFETEGTYTDAIVSQTQPDFA